MGLNATAKTDFSSPCDYGRNFYPSKTVPALVALLLLLVLGVGESRATILYWYPAAAPNQGGTGTWDGATATRWSTTSGATKTNSATIPQNGDDVVLGGTAGTVSITSPTNLLNDFKIETSGYTISPGTTTGQTLSLTTFSGSGLGGTVLTHGRSSSAATWTLVISGSTSFNGTIRDNTTNSQLLNLTKSGTGSLDISAATIAYNGTTIINDGTLRVASAFAGAPPAGHIQIGSSTNGTSGIIEVNGAGSASSIIRSLASSGNNTLRLGGGGTSYSNVVAGFSAVNGSLTVNIGGNNTADTLAWQAAGLMRINTLQLGTSSSTDTVTLQNSLNIDAGDRTIRTGNGSALVDAQISGAITLTASGSANQILTKDGAGTLLLSGASDFFNGRLNAAAGTTLVDGSLSSSTSNATYGIQVGASATLGGDGSITLSNASANTNVSGILMAGRGLGNQSLTINSNLNMLSNSTLVFGLGATSSDRDQLIRTGGTWSFQSDQKVTLWDAGYSGNPGSFALITGLASDPNVSGWQLFNTAPGIDGSLRYSGGSVFFDVATASTDYYWKGNLDGNWNTLSGGATNWTSDAGGSSGRTTLPGTDAAIIFAATGAGNLTTSLGQNMTVQSLKISTSNVTIGSGNTLTLNGTGATIILVDASAGTTTINADLAGSTSGPSMSGNSLLVLGGNNSFGGGILLESGTIRIQEDAALGAQTGNLTFASTTNSTLQAGANGIVLGANRSVILSTGTGRIDTQSHNMTVASTLSGSTTLEKVGSGTLTLSGGLFALGGTISLQAGTLAIDTTAGNQTLAATLTGAAAFQKAGTGTLTLSANNTSYTGNITVTSGALRLTNANALGSSSSGNTTVSSGAAIELSGGITIAEQSFVMSGSGVDNTGALRNISGNNTWNTGSVNTITLAGDSTFGSDAGLLTIFSTSGSSISGSGYNIHFVGAGDFDIRRVISIGTGNLTMNGSGTLRIGVNAASTYTGDTIINSGTLALGRTNTLGVTNIVLNGGALDISSFDDGIGGVTLNQGSIIGTTGTLSGTSYTMSNGSVSAILGGTNVALTKTGAGTVALTANNTYSGKTLVNQGALSFSAGNATATGSQSLGTNATLDLGVALTSSGTLNFTGSTDTLAKNINILGNGSDTIRNSGTGLLTLSGNIVKNGTTLVLMGGAQGITVSGVISGSSANSDLIIDGGTVTLSGANTYNGPTSIINGAVLNANAVNALPTANGRSHTSMDASGSGHSTLALGASQSIASLSGTTTSNLTLGAHTLTIGTSSGNTTFAGRISGAGNLVKDGASIQVLSGNNSYTGTTTVTSGTLQANSANSLGSTSAIEVTGGSLLVTANGALNGKNITLNSTSTTIAGLAFSGNYNGSIGTLTLSSNSIIDLGENRVVANFADIAFSDNYSILKIYNWSGTTLWGGTDRDNTDQLYVTANLEDSELSRISFYSDFGNSFLGTGYQLSGSGFYNNQVIPVPEPGIWATATVLLMGIGLRFWNQRRWSSSKPI